MNKERLEEALQFAREHGLPSITVDGVTMVVPKETSAPTREYTEEEFKKLYPQEEPMTDEEVLYWSTPYYDEIQARKKAEAEAQKEKEALND